MRLRDNILDTLERLVHIPGISGTKFENDTAVEIYNMLKEIPYLNINSENVIMHKINGDIYGRHFITALLKGKNPSNRTIVLTGHYDVVGIEEFGQLKEFAFNIKEYTKKVRELNLSEDAARDLKSGDWIFGRGSADMKYGLALEIEILRALSEDRNFTGNILFLAVPGEESNSEGMLAAAKYIAELQKEGYDFSGLLLSECCMPKYPGDCKKRLYTGTCGKVMPFFFCTGKETHVCEPFSGFNPNLLVSEINRLMELNTDFCDNDSNTITPPPVCLKQTDLKELYSVQTPIYAVSYYNLITLEMDIDKTMIKLKEIAENAFNNAKHIVKERYSKFKNTDAECQKEGMADVESSIYTFSDIYRRVIDIYGDEFKMYLEQKNKEWREQGFDNQTIGINIARETYDKYPDKKPMIIIGFLPPFYPDRNLKCDNIKNTEFMSAIKDVIEFARDRFKVSINIDEHFMGICDLSYTGFSGRDVCEIENNMCAGENYMLPIEQLRELDIPSVVFGGYGKDFHKNTERLNLSYSMDVVPKLYMKLIKDVLK